jgi:UDPglucose 6-dehydrogenase/GDP-mannose 6-dehydrogenase
VLGTGYVGLVSAVGLANQGHDVVGIDVRPEIVDSLSHGESPIFEPGLSDSLAAALSAGRIRFSVPDTAALASAEVILIAVGTPTVNGHIDLSFITSAADMAGSAIALSDHTISVIVKSTVVPGTTSGVVRERIDAALAGKGREYGLGMNPEFLREGSAILDFSEPDRIVFGFEDEIALGHLREMYAGFSCEKLEVNTKTAELIKYANNTLLALQISATNEIANLAAAIGGIDPLAVMRGVVMDRRWSGDAAQGEKAHGIASYLIPGPGFGGSCFPKDVQALLDLGESRGMPMAVTRSILEVISHQPQSTVQSTLSDLPTLRGVSTVVLGLAFKPDTDDVRESPAVGIISALLDEGASVRAHDPIASANFERLMPAAGVEYLHDWRAAVADADVVFVVTPWREYRDLAEFIRAGAIVVDPRRAFPSESFASVAEYRSIGFRA